MVVPSEPKPAQLVESFGAGLLPFQIAKALASVVPKANKTSAAKPDSLATRSRIRHRQLPFEFACYTLLEKSQFVPPGGHTFASPLKEPLSENLPPEPNETPP